MIPIFRLPSSPNSAPWSSSRIAVKPSSARSGARKSCDTEELNDFKSSLACVSCAINSSRVRAKVRCVRTRASNSCDVNGLAR